MKSLYYSLVFPYMNYCNLIWGNAFSVHLNPLVILQKKVIRLINNKPLYHHPNELFIRSNLLKLADVYKLNVASYMFKLDDHAIFNRPHSHNTRSAALLYPNFNRLSVTQHSITYMGPKIWNSIRSSIKESASLRNFKNNFKKYLVSEYNDA